MNALPEALAPLAALPRFVLWREEVDPAGKRRKVPYQVNGRRASSTRPGDWSPWSRVRSELGTGRYTGPGIVLGDLGDGRRLVGIDLDLCRSPLTGRLMPWGQEIVDEAGTYTEVSPSGTGVKLLGYVSEAVEVPVKEMTVDAALPEGAEGTDHGAPEIGLYPAGRYFTVTGQRVDGTPAELGDITGVVRRLALPLQAAREANGKAHPPDAVARLLERDAKLRRLWRDGSRQPGDRSANDLALAGTLRRLGVGDRDIRLALAVYPLGQIGGGKLAGAAAERRLDRILAELGEGAREPWAEPEPLQDGAGDEPETFPLEALPPSAAAAVREYQAYGRQPLAMVACSALGAMSLAGQGLADVRRDAQLVGPVSLSLYVVAESGERKTACDRAFSAAAERWARAEAKRLAPLLAAAREARDAHAAEKQGLLAALRDAAGKAGKGDGTAKEADADELKRRLQEHGRALPPLPPTPTPLVENGTAEGIANLLRFAWPSAAWWSNEGANVTGGHAFRDDRLAAGLAFLNSRWDGASMDRARAAEDYAKVHGRRLTVSLMLQPAAFAAFAGAGGGMARGLGALSRFLGAWPASTMGSRLRDEDGGEPELPALGAFLKRAEELHREPLPMAFDMATMEVKADAEGNAPADPLELSPAELPLDPDARRLWLRYHNEVERELAAEGDYSTVRDVAAKSAENACRLAALFHVWRAGPAGAVGAGDMAGGVAVARWFLREARRVFGSAAGDAEGADAGLLAAWVKSCERPPSLKDAAQLAPYRLRDKARRDAAMALLEARHWARREKRDGRTVIALNPGLAWEA